jgi:hypothetical protein
MNQLRKELSLTLYVNVLFRTSKKQHSEDGRKIVEVNMKGFSFFLLWKSISVKHFYMDIEELCIFVKMNRTKIHKWSGTSRTTDEKTTQDWLSLLKPTIATRVENHQQ